MQVCLLQDPVHNVVMKVQGQSATRSDICRLEDLIAAMQQQPIAPLRLPAAAGTAAVVAADAVIQSEPPDARITSLPAATPPPTRAAKPSSQVTYLCPAVLLDGSLRPQHKPCMDADFWSLEQMLQIAVRKWILCPPFACNWLPCPKLATAAFEPFHAAHHMAMLLLSLLARLALVICVLLHPSASQTLVLYYNPGLCCYRDNKCNNNF